MPVPGKIALLRTLCDDVLDTPVVKSQVDIREEQFPLCIENEAFEVKERRNVQHKKAQVSLHAPWRDQIVL